MNLDVAPLKKVSLSKQVADQLQEAILDGTLKADDRLPTEEELGQRFQVSRPTIREALKRLAAKNLIRSRRGPTGGTFVNRLDANELSDGLSTASTLFVSMNDISLEEVSSCRKDLETLCFQLACDNASGDDIKNMEAALNTQEDPSISPEAFCAADVQFHRAIADATGNRMLSFVMYSLIEGLQPVANMIAYHYRAREVIINQHQRILENIKERDTNTAISVLHEQIDYLSQLHKEAQNNHQKKG
ncbi:MAG: FadR/GntR family transcriptional regulator [Neptuniibacter sp.]